MAAIIRSTGRLHAPAWLLSCTVVLLLYVSPSSAQPPPPKSKLDVEAGIGTWISEGSTRWSHNASHLDPDLGNPTSDLRYKDLWSNVIEARGRVTLDKKVFLRGVAGFGDIHGGRLIDDDYLSTGRFLRTFSDVSGSNLWYVTTDLGSTFLALPDERGRFRLFWGYQFWRERVAATGITYIECTSPPGFIVVGCPPPGTVTDQGRTVITNTAQWHSVRLGLEGDYQVLSRLGIQGMIVFIPHASMRNEDIHHLRSDLQQNPSFSMSGRGMGVNAEVNLTLRIVQRLSLNVGYRYWWLEVTDGTWRGHPVSAPSATANLNRLRSIRQGVVLGLSYTF